MEKVTDILTVDIDFHLGVRGQVFVGGHGHGEFAGSLVQSEGGSFVPGFRFGIVIGHDAAGITATDRRFLGDGVDTELVLMGKGDEFPLCFIFDRPEITFNIPGISSQGLILLTLTSYLKGGKAKMPLVCPLVETVGVASSVGSLVTT